MARHSGHRWYKLKGLLLGGGLILLALWNISNRDFCSGGCGLLFSLITAPLFEHFGHWGPRVALLAVGTSFVALSLIRGNNDDEGPSNS